ncbi:BrnA antitoxin family protein [Eubacteriales bacterium OttesenSCG-928-M02]|nr:BrnA antitoxin family protein [Eubacteriales bacterium OttesenSCG-928-M02]
MFRVTKPEMTNRTFRLPVDLLERLEAVAQQSNVSVNNLVKQCCEYALDNLEIVGVNDGEENTSEN